MCENHAFKNDITGKPKNNIQQMRKESVYLRHVFRFNFRCVHLCFVILIFMYYDI